MDDLAQKLDALLRTRRRGDAEFGGACHVGGERTDLDRVRLFWSEHSTHRSASVADEGLVFLLSGRKIGYLGERQFTYDADRCLVVSAALPYEYSAVASPESPLLGLFVRLDLAELGELAAALDRHPSTNPRPAEPTLGLSTVPLDSTLRDVLRRLLDCLSSARDCEVLGPGLLRELNYRVLTSPGGEGLRALTLQDTSHARIVRLLADVKRDVAVHHSVEELARSVGMSQTVFHRAFRKLTGESPISYIKKLRLHHAGTLILYDALSVSDAARRVGYRSPTQFSREFKRLFGHPPSSLRAQRPLSSHAPETSVSAH